MKGIILAGGSGTRLYPLTLVASKQLQAVYDKPLIYYPLTILIASGIREICLITTESDLPLYMKLLGDGSRFGISIVYKIQQRPEGIAQAFIIAEEFIEDSNVTLILGDNIFFGGDAFPRAFRDFRDGALIFAYHVHDPERYGVVSFDKDYNVTSLEEKPKNPKSNYAVPGVYIYDKNVVHFAKQLKPSARGELEITDLNKVYLHQEKLKVVRLSRGFAWLDAGTSSSLHDASNYVYTIEKRQGIKIGCPEEAAMWSGFIKPMQLQEIANSLPNCEYKSYLLSVVIEAQRMHFNNETE